MQLQIVQLHVLQPLQIVGHGEQIQAISRVHMEYVVLLTPTLKMELVVLLGMSAVFLIQPVQMKNGVLMLLHTLIMEQFGLVIL